MYSPVISKVNSENFLGSYFLEDIWAKKKFHYLFTFLKMYGEYMIRPHFLLKSGEYNYMIRPVTHLGKFYSILTECTVPYYVLTTMYLHTGCTLQKEKKIADGISESFLLFSSIFQVTC